MITLGIVDDHFDIRQNLKRVFELFDEIDLVFEGKDGKDAVAYMKSNQRKPDVLLMDIEMREMNGIEATRLIKELETDTKILVLSVLDDENNIKAALAAGADGYMLKAEKPLKMVELIKATHEGRFPLSPKVAEVTRKQFMKTNGQALGPKDFHLTKRELQILLEIVEGLSYNQVAEKLIIAPKTVQGHVENIYRKMNVHSKVEASRIVFKNGWL